MRTLNATEVAEVSGGLTALEASLGFVGLAVGAMVASPVVAGVAAGASIAAAGLAIYQEL